MMPMIPLHVNAVTGHDTNNDGLSEGAPFKTLTKLLSVATWKHELFLQSNINGEGDSHYRGTLILPPGARCRGLGESRPLVDAFRVAPNASFTATPGRTGIYQLSWTHSITPGGTSFFSAHIDGEPVRRAASLDALEAMSTAGLYPGAVSSATQTIYLRAPDGGDISVPDSYGIEITAYNHAGTGRAVRLSGIDFKGCGSNDGVGSFGRFSRVENCDFTYGTKHNLFMSGRSRFSNVVCEYGDPSYGGTPGAGASTLFVGYDIAGLDLDLENCTGRHGYVFPEHATNQTLAMYAHTTSDPDEWARVRLSGFHAEDVGQSATGLVDTWQISGCTETDVYQPGYPS